jgi:hypothetical protein
VCTVCDSNHLKSENTRIKLHYCSVSTISTIISIISFQWNRNTSFHMLRRIILIEWRVVSVLSIGMWLLSKCDFCCRCRHFVRISQPSRMMRPNCSWCLPFLYLFHFKTKIHTRMLDDCITCIRILHFVFFHYIVFVRFSFCLLYISTVKQFSWGMPTAYFFVFLVVTVIYTVRTIYPAHAIKTT